MASDYLTIIDVTRDFLRSRPRREFSLADLDVLRRKPTWFSMGHAATELVDTGLALRLYAGLFWFTDGDPTSKPDHLTPYWVANQLAGEHPWFFSFDTALAIHGLGPHGTTLRTNTARPRRRVTFMGNYQLAGAFERGLNTEGVSKVDSQVGRLPVASPERALVDTLALPRHVGGILSAVRLVTSQKGKFDPAELCRTAASLGWPATMRRVGFVLDALGLHGPHLNRLLARLSNSQTLFDPNGPTVGGKTEVRWRMRMNVDRAQLDAALNVSP